MINVNEHALLNILQILAIKIQGKQFVIDKTGVKTVEIIGAYIPLDPKQKTFNFCDIRKTNEKYVKDELDWYNGQSLYVKDLRNTPEIWKKVCSKDGKINSNYGYLIYSKENGSQYENCVKELKSNECSRRAMMIYTRPSMHVDYNTDGMSDFICTSGVQAFIRNNKLYFIVSMRSNDLVYGFLNDWYWQATVYEKMLLELRLTYPKLEYGEVIWQAGSLHVYEPHFELILKIAATLTDELIGEENAHRE